MARQLPVVEVEEEGNTLFFFDERLKEIREVDNLHNVIRLNEFEITYYKDKKNQVNAEEEICD